MLDTGQKILLEYFPSIIWKISWSREKAVFKWNKCLIKLHTYHKIGKKAIHFTLYKK